MQYLRGYYAYLAIIFRLTAPLEQHEIKQDTEKCLKGSHEHFAFIRRFFFIFCFCFPLEFFRCSFLNRKHNHKISIYMLLLPHFLMSRLVNVYSGTNAFL